MKPEIYFFVFCSIFCFFGKYISFGLDFTHDFFGLALLFKPGPFFIITFTFLIGAYWNSKTVEKTSLTIFRLSFYAIVI